MKSRNINWIVFATYQDPDSIDYYHVEAFGLAKVDAEKEISDGKIMIAIQQLLHDAVKICGWKYMQAIALSPDISLPVETNHQNVIIRNFGLEKITLQDAEKTEINGKENIKNLPNSKRDVYVNFGGKKSGYFNPDEVESFALKTDAEYFGGQPGDE